MNEGLVRAAIGQWRDALVNLSKVNRLINYRPTRSSTIEFTRHDGQAVYEIIGSAPITFVKGTRPPEKPKPDTTDASVDSESGGAEDLEEAVLSQIQPFDFDEFPDHLFADKTQRDVDKALRNLAAIAKREYIDKGLRVLYVAFGELRWIDEAEDERRSPLVLLPVELVSPGPRERLYMQFSEDDAAVNPALALKLLDDYGISLPSLEEVLTAIDNAGIVGALRLFESLDFPDGWQVVDGAALSVFMFAKEAMYRDLLENEEKIASSPIVQALSGAAAPGGEQFAFDPYKDDQIDQVAPPETTPLVLDADASQRAAVQAAVEGRSFTLDGPPGTGKSQTIANIIASLIAEGKTVLFVSEKAVALDVVRDRLALRGLDPFLFELHSSKSARKEVAARLGSALSARPVPPTPMADVRIQQLRETRRALTEYVIAANEKRAPLGASVHEVLGWLEQQGPVLSGPSFYGDVRALSSETLAELETAISRVERTWNLRLEGNQAVWFGLQGPADLAFPLTQLQAFVEELRPFAFHTLAVRGAFELTRLSELDKVEQLLTAWHERPEYHDRSWLDVPNVAELSRKFDDYASSVTRLDQARHAAKTSGGERWQDLPVHDLSQLETLTASLASADGPFQRESLDELDQELVGARAALDCLDELTSASERFAQVAGIKPPTTPRLARTLFEAGRAMLSVEHFNVDWVYRADYVATARELATVCEKLELEREQAANEASSTFTTAALTADLVETSKLIAAARGVTKRFSEAHRQMRSALAVISTAKWRIARDAMPLAEKWQHADRVYRATAQEAAGVLSATFRPEGGTNWREVDRELTAAADAASAEFMIRTATDRLCSDELVRQQAREDLIALERSLSAWQSASWSDMDRKGSADQQFSYSRQRLRHGIELLEALQMVVRSHGPALASTSSVSEHLAVANDRAIFDQAQGEAQEARKAFTELLDIDSDSLGLELNDVAREQPHIEWVREVYKATCRSDDAGLSAAHIRALQETPPISGVKKPLERYRAAVREFLAAFETERASELDDDLDDLDAAEELIASMQANLEGVDDWVELLKSTAELDRLGLARSVQHALEQRAEAGAVQPYLRATVYRAWINAQLMDDARFTAIDSTSRDELVAKFRELDAELVETAVSRVIESAVARRPRSSLGQAGIIRREAEKKRRHMPVRDLIAQAREVIQALHPCFMMSPLAVSQYLPPEELFDVVIFDEASQVMPADAINCLYRSRAAITAGDQKQLPPTSFFEAASDPLDDDDEEDVAKDFESILDLMKSSGQFTAQSLRWHYRSRHEHLISYSNASFYESRLITFPSAVDESEDAGVRFLKVPGVYRRSAGQDNPIEAKHVAERVIHHYATRPHKTLGVVAFSAAQRDAIEAAVDLARAERPDLDGYFTDERGTGFFVKSLESVQGDERDVIIFSIGYGPDENGKVYRNFGPVGRSGGERRLNVAITRAKELVEVVSSMSASDIGEVNSEGSRHLRRYLDYAERGPAALAIELGPSGIGTDSPFEDAVLEFVRSLGFEAQPQVGVAGYRIDLGVKHPNQPGAFMLGIECDGAAYHSSKAARDRDRIRHEILEGLGWRIHHIWGTAWYRHNQREKDRLRVLLDELAAKPVSGRLATPPTPPPPARVFELTDDDLDIDPEWVVDYQIAKVDRIPSYIDLSDSGNGRWLRTFVEAVAEVESPIHIDVLAQRLRENSQYGRIGAKIRQTLMRAIRVAEVQFDGEFVRREGAADCPVRRSVPECIRTVAQVPDEEIRQAIVQFVADAVSVTRPQLVSAVAAIFGWRRVGADIRDRIDGALNVMISEGTLEAAHTGDLLGMGSR